MRPAGLIQLRHQKRHAQQRICDMYGLIDRLMTRRDDLQHLSHEIDMQLMEMGMAVTLRLELKNRVTGSKGRAQPDETDD